MLIGDTCLIQDTTRRRGLRSGGRAFLLRDEDHRTGGSGAVGRSRERLDALPGNYFVQDARSGSFTKSQQFLLRRCWQRRHTWTKRTVSLSNHDPVDTFARETCTGTARSGCSRRAAVWRQREGAGEEAVAHGIIRIRPGGNGMRQVPDLHTSALPRPRGHKAAIPETVVDGPCLQTLPDAALSVGREKVSRGPADTARQCSNAY